MTAGTAIYTVTDVNTPEEMAAAALLEACEAEEEVLALVEWLGEQTWSDFAQSLSKFWKERGYLTPKQVTAARSMFNKQYKAPLDDVPVPTTPHMIAKGDMFKVDGDIFHIKAGRTGGTYALQAKVQYNFPHTGDVRVAWVYRADNRNRRTR